ncbi:MAG: FAD-dependent oxidoreductase, partial [Patescibacteria group bacterium]
RHDIRKLYPKKSLAISIIQSQKSLMTPLPEHARDAIRKKLESMGVRIFFNASVKEVQKNAVVLASGETIPSDITVWAAGLRGFADEFLPPEYVSNGRIPVNQFLHHADDSSLYALGDISLALNERGAPYPQLGEAAHNAGTYVARHIIADIKKQPTRPFHFESKGTLMPIGDWDGIVSIKNRWSFSGSLAWWIRRTFYLLFVPGILRKLRIIADWNFHLFGFRYMLDMNKERKRK